jgi:acyl-CoA hydrolase
MDPIYISPEEAISKIQSGNRIFVQGSAATPAHLLRTYSNELANLKTLSWSVLQRLEKIFLNPAEFGKSFFMNSLFVSDNVREIVNSSSGEYVPVFLSEIHLLFERNILPIDVALIHVSQPDKHGYCSLGTSIDIARAAV